MYWVYALLSLKDGSIYVGMTGNWVNRLRLHEAGAVISTRDRRPFKVLYLEEVPTRKRARQLEVYLKSGEGRRFLRSKIGAAEK
jgi:putative endonuclease